MNKDTGYVYVSESGGSSECIVTIRDATGKIIERGYCLPQSDVKSGGYSPEPKPSYQMTHHMQAIISLIISMTFGMIIFGTVLYNIFGG